MALEKEARTNIMGSSLDIRNRNWDKVSAHLADYTSLISGGETYESVIGGGWTGALYYRKNDLGQGFLYGEAVATGTVGPGVRLLTLPEGFRPLIHVAPSAFNFTKILPLAGNFVLGTNGGLDIRVATNIASGDSIRFNLIFQAE